MSAPGSANRGLMHRQCAWCKTSMGSVPCAPDMHGKTTHGICPACAAEMVASAQQARRATWCWEMPAAVAVVVVAIGVLALTN